MRFQRINVKLFVDAPATIDLDPFLSIFARWRQDTTHPSRWVDLADYAHVRKGPGVMIIGKQGHLSLDLADPGPGILYANRSDLDGTLEERLFETFRRSLTLTEALTNEPEFPPGLAPRPGFWELCFNDRLEFPNTDATDLRLRPAIERSINHIFGPDHSLVREMDPGRRYGFVIHAAGIDDLKALQSKLQSGSLP